MEVSPGPPPRDLHTRAGRAGSEGHRQERHRQHDRRRGGRTHAAPHDQGSSWPGEGAWLGVWILCVVWPALLLYRLADAAGLERIGGVFTTLLPQRRETLLLVAWILPAFVQGVAGFGTPIAVVAPLLVAMGWSGTRAVASALIGYQWSVTFGSMGSSFYI